jgi:cyclohexanone monooxygenase
VKNAQSSEAVFDALIVGAGFAGLYAIYRLRGLGMSLRCIEAAPDVGGVWYWNRYPGARCDVESQQYSYSFSKEIERDWKWSERFSAQPEILSYLQYVADQLGLRREIAFETRVVSAAWHDADKAWDVVTDRNETVRARHLIMASGGLSVTRTPDFPGLDQFEGEIYHTGMWSEREVEFRGKRVCLIGTGSSGIQAAPVIAERAADVTVFQRTPNFIIPARNRSLTEQDHERWLDNATANRARARQVGTLYEFSNRGALDVDAETRREEYERRWQIGGVNFVHSFNNIYTDLAANETAADFVREKIRSIVKDPVTAEKLCPKDHPLGSKRICVASGYYEAFNRPNLHLVDIREEPLESMTSKGLRTSAREYPADVIVFATGYDALTGALTAIDIRGEQGRELSEKWARGPINYIGLMTEGFPNMYVVTGPGSPSVLVNMVVGIEQHIDWIADCMAYLRALGHAGIEPTAEAEKAWIGEVNAEADKTLFVKANSWYLGANIPGKPRVFLPYAGGLARYRAKCDEVTARGYEGFRILAA